MLGPRSQLLLSVSSDALGDPVSSHDLPAGRVLDELAELLSARNGFYAFEAALHVMGCGPGVVVGGSTEGWNSREGWRSDYDGLADGFFFFAEDVFGTQFAVRDEKVFTFDPETGQAEIMASSIEDWADQVLGNYRLLTGFPVAHDWQRVGGSIPPGSRLIPRRPFVLGGDFAVANVYALDAVEGMRVRADLALQIRDLPDGSKIRYRVVE